MLCVIFKVRQSANTAHVVGIVRIIHRCVFLLSDMAAMCVRSAISVFATTAPTTASARKFGERRWIYETNEL